MASTKSLLDSSIGKKLVMALTGLFLCIFLVGHLAGNLQLIIGDQQAAQEQFNAYAKFMTSNPLVKILSYLTYASILFHAFRGLMLVRQNKLARPITYNASPKSKTSHWTSRSMGVLGTLILVFIIIHMNDFWKEMHFEMQPTYKLSSGEMVKDLYSEVIEAFESPMYVLFYVLAMAAVGFHLWHGVKSAFQTLGLGQKKYVATIEKVSYGFALVIPFLFAIIPVIIYLKH